MQVVHGSKVPETVRVHKHRVGEFRFRRLLTGVPGTPGNFVLELVTTTNDFFSPRHRHNFDQFRYQVEGDFDFDRNGKMKPGVLGYFPEGTPYGPQTSADHSLTLVLQFGGASGQGYMAAEQIEKGTEELKKHGYFENGIFHRHDGEEGRKNVDGYQAIWELANGRPMVYPKPRYHDPIMMYPEAYDWVAHPAEAGVHTRRTGAFGERGSECGFLKLDAGARHRAEGRRIYVALDGACTLAGEASGRFSALYCETGESADIVAKDETTLLVLSMPVFADSQHQRIAAE